MADNPNIEYDLSTEIYDRIVERSPDLIDQMTDIGFQLRSGARHSGRPQHP